jgi:hypothetical protein
MGLRDEIWVIGAAVYVLGMFPLYYLYTVYPMQRFGDLISRITIISLFGAIGLLFIYILIAAWGSGDSDEGT